MIKRDEEASKESHYAGGWESIIGEKIVNIEIEGGGLARCQRINLLLPGGKHAWVEAKLEITERQIKAMLCYGSGVWERIGGNNG